MDLDLSSSGVSSNSFSYRGWECTNRSGRGSGGMIHQLDLCTRELGPEVESNSGRGVISQAGGAALGASCEPPRPQEHGDDSAGQWRRRSRAAAGASGARRGFGSASTRGCRGARACGRRRCSGWAGGWLQHAGPIRRHPGVEGDVTIEWQIQEGPKIQAQEELRRRTRKARRRRRKSVAVPAVGQARI